MNKLINIFLISAVMSPSFISHAMEKEDNVRLPPLSKKDREATFGHSLHHSVPKSEFSELHRTGNTWPDDRLQKIFLEGLFQHYTYQMTGFYYTPDNRFYENLRGKHQYPLSLWHAQALQNLYVKNNLDRPKWGPIPTHHDYYRALSYSPQSLEKKPFVVNFPSENDIEDTMPIARWFKLVADALKLNFSFRTLSSDFMRHKIIIEKMVEDDSNVKDQALQESIKKGIYLEDSLEDDRQVLLFNWMQDSYSRATEILKESIAKDGKAPLDNHPFLIELTLFSPEYLYRPVYKDLVRHLPAKG